jgi:hypothetical protein
MEESDVDSQSQVILTGDDAFVNYLYCFRGAMNYNKLIIYASSVPATTQLSAA